MRNGLPPNLLTTTPISASALASPSIANGTLLKSAEDWLTKVMSGCAEAVSAPACFAAASFPAPTIVMASFLFEFETDMDSVDADLKTRRNGNLSLHGPASHRQEEGCKFPKAEVRQDPLAQDRLSREGLYRRGRQGAR